MTSRQDHPAGIRLVTASVAWSDHTALLEVVNRRGRIVEVIVEGTTEGTRRVRLRGNDRIALMYDVRPGDQLTITVDDDSRRILYAGSSD
jgi:hypothetical protein